MAPSSRRSESGAVSTLWVVILVIAWLASLGLWYSTTSEVSTARADAAAVKVERDKYKGLFEDKVKTMSALSEVVGFRDPANASSSSDPVAIKAATDAAKADAGDALGGADTKVTLQQTITVLRDALKAKVGALDQANTELKAEVGKRRAAEDSVASSTSGMKTQLDQLNQQLADERQRADSQTQQDTRRFDELVAAQQASDASARQSQQQLAELQVKARRDSSALEGQLKALAERREAAAPDAVDGSVLSVGSTGALAYIDLGAKQGLRRGTKFEVLRPGKAGELVPKGTLEVREVEDDMSLAGLTTDPNAFDPILPGDKLRNPHFEPNHVLHFFLLGDFPITMGKEQATARLKELGAAVDDKLGTSTDVLVIGSKPAAEGESGPELTDSDEYKLADKLGIRIMRFAELADFLKY
jgi:hypothetical protein